MISPKNLLRISTVVSTVALTLSAATVPAYAMQDIAIDDSPRSFATAAEDTQNAGDGMPDNPNAALPDTVSGRISDDSTVVSEKLAVTPKGEVRDLETGKTVTDKALVGTRDQQPDPLAKTDGESFIPVSASDVKDAVKQPVKQSVGQSTEQSSSKGEATVRLAKFEGNDYGAHWGTYDNTKAFFDYKNNLFVQQAKGVIDVSSWQGDIDWAKAKADGVEGAIIRLGYGWGNDADAKAKRNINECKRLGIPFGIYWYSYAEDASGSRQEGNDVVAKLRQLGVSPNDLKYPVYYDLERWTWTGHTPPTDPNVYNGMVNAWYSVMQSAGYTNLGVYSYTSYLQGPLNNTNIHAKTRWVAQYGPQMEYTAFGTNDRGWQYTESGQIDGISGSVDLNAFGDKTSMQNVGNDRDLLTDFEVKGDMGKEWHSIGAEKSVIGRPVANEVCDWSSGNVNCYQNFEHGAISWTPSTGAHYTTGEIRKEWARRNYEHGVLGYPTEDEKKVSSNWISQRFQRGDIWTCGKERYVMLLNLRDSWNMHRGFSWLGAPVANEENMGNGYWRQRCENGDVWTRNGASEKYVVMFNLRDSFNKNGGYSSLGGPVAEEENMGRGWWRQRFQHGDVWSKDGTNQRFVIKFDLRDSWNMHRGFSWLGAPVANEENMGNGYWRQRCENGDVWTRNGASKKYVVMFNLRKEYYARGGYAKLGGPVSEERNLGNIWRQDCMKGVIYAY